MMKTLLKVLPALVLIMALVSCAVQKRVTDKSEVKSVVSNMLYDQAFNALNERCFIIHAEQLFFPDGKSKIQNLTDSYISMLNNEATMRFAPNLFPSRQAVYNLNMKDVAAKLTKGTVKKDGDVQFVLDFRGDYYTGMRLKILITLYNNSNKCYVKVNGGNFQTDNMFDFKGEVLPLENFAEVDE